MSNLICGDCLDKLKELPDNSVDAVVADPPYGLSFMGKKWDYDVPSEEIWRECLRVLKPGGHLLAFAGTRTQHRMAVRIEDAGFEIRDMVAWIYSGYPKNLDIAKAIDKARTEDVEPVRVICRAIRAAMDRAGLKSRDLVAHFGNCHPRLVDHWAARDTDSQPALPTPEQWATLRSVLDLGDTYDAEVARLNARKGQPSDTWQTARIVGEYTPMSFGFGGDTFATRDNYKRKASDAAEKWTGWGTALRPCLEPITVARKPLEEKTTAANVLTHGTGALNIDATRFDNRYPGNLVYTGDGLLGRVSPFYYHAKTSKADRGPDNDHPTVKPTDLMRYLCRLVTPPGGVVLDPFMGSGSTGKAARLEGFHFIGIEKDPEYFEIAKARIVAAKHE